MSEPISIRRAFAGKHVLLTGASGFVGKVWLTLMLDRVPEIGRIYVLLRSKALLSARERFEKMVNTSPAFRPLHERLGPAFSSFLADRVEVIEGELGADDLGLEPAALARLRRDVDLVVHCAGLVDFNPDLRKALSTNVEGTMRVADFVESSERAALLHISTCYVAGRRSGVIAERAHPEYSPLGGELDAAAEMRAAFTACEELCARHESQQHAEAVRTEVAAMVRGRRTGDRARLIANLARRRLREEQKQALVDEGMARAQRLGWPNTYTYSKSLAESLLLRRKGLRLAILRPSIVESALEYPFPGWNESFNGSAPLAYVMGSWFRMIPAKPDAPFDVIPVDEVCKAMSIAGAALLLGRHSPVYHVGSSDLHRCSVGRAAELIVLAHRRHFRQLGNERNERIFKSRWDAVLVEPDTVFGVGRNRALLDGAREAIGLLPDKIERKAKRMRDRLDRADKKLAQIEEMIRLYLPFMYESFYVFQALALPSTPALEPELRFAPERIDWRKYWIEVHVPGLRRWAFPLIEGKRPERYRPDHPVRLPPALPALRVPTAEGVPKGAHEMSADAASAED
ncbi:MAG TPA: SDR family oxidoreductase [Polyangiales bacterium]|nr:SDR family oxidoreductase [Polyangiales bacterium]